MAAATTVNLDMSLDDMIASRPKANNRRRGGGAGGGGGRRNAGGNGSFVLGGGAARGNNRSGRRNAPYTVPPGPSGGGSKIVVSNLHQNVTEADLKELFTTQVGPLSKVTLSFDSAGRSRGIAHVIFRREQDAAIAFQRYNGVTLDGRPMRIEIVLQPGQVAAASNGGRRNIVVGAPNARKNGRGAAAGGKGGRGGRRGGEKKTPKTAEELDAEMAAYMSQAADKSQVAIDEDTPM